MSAIWESRRLRGERVWVRLKPSGEPAAGPDGRVEVRYRPGGKVYRASLRNLEVDAEVERVTDSVEASAAPVTSAAAADAITVYTDGACTGNPGPMGIGVVILDGKERKEVSEFLGMGTNNIAELVAIERALELCARERQILVHSDSAYALGLLGKNWKAKANQTLVAKIRMLTAQFADIRYIKVAGHAGVPENERCDELAREAIRRGK